MGETGGTLYARYRTTSMASPHLWGEPTKAEVMEAESRAVVTKSLVQVAGI
jgi:hypothetical protein